MSPPILDLSREQALAFRLRRHHLAKRLGPKQGEAAAVVGLQDTPPGTAGLALAARADAAPEALDELVLVPSVRGAPLAVAERDLPIFTAGLEPPDEEAAKAVIGNAWKSLDGITAMEALDRVSEAVHESLRDGPLPRDDFHQALRERLPAELLWWCKGCGSHHVHPSLWRATGISGVLAIVGREGRSAVFGLPPKAPAMRRPRRRARPPLPAGLRPGAAEAAGRLGRPRVLARQGAVGARRRLTPVDLEGRKHGRSRGRGRAGRRSRRPEGVRLLPNLDPLVRPVTASCSCRTRSCASGSGASSAARGSCWLGRAGRPVATGQEGQEAGRHGRAARDAHPPRRRTSWPPRRTASHRSAEPRARSSSGPSDETALAHASGR